MGLDGALIAQMAHLEVHKARGVRVLGLLFLFLFVRVAVTVGVVMAGMFCHESQSRPCGRKVRFLPWTNAALRRLRPRPVQPMIITSSGSFTAVSRQACFITRADDAFSGKRNPR